MSSIKADRLRQARANAGFESAAEAARAFGWGEAGYRHHENGTREFDAAAAKKYGKAFKVNPGWLLALDAITVAKSELPTIGQEPVWLEVTGRVAAGTWREHHDLPPEERIKIEVNPYPFSRLGVERYALILEGNSMDKIIPPGSVLDCLRPDYDRVTPTAGDLVIVERRRHDLVEMTCKRLARVGDDWELRPESNDPKFQDPIRIKDLRRDASDDEEVRVIGIVLEARQVHYRPAHQRFGILN